MMIILQAGNVGNLINQVLGIIKPIIDGVTLVFAIIWWTSLVFLLVYAIYRITGETPGRRAYGLQAIVDWGINHITTFLAIFIVLLVVLFALSAIASAAGYSFTISAGQIFYDFVIKPIIDAFHMIIGT